MQPTFVETIVKLLKKRWNKFVIESYNEKEFLTGGSLALDIYSLIKFWKELDLNDGSKIAICVPSGLQWAKLFLAISCSNHVAVVLPGDIESALIAAAHSDCDALYVQEANLRYIDVHKFKNLRYIISIEGNKILWTQSHKNMQFCQSPQITRADFIVPHRNVEDMALLIYTSGTSSHIKGVMLSFQNLSVCINANYPRFKYEYGENHLNILPLNHIFGLMYDLLLPLCSGMKLTILDKPPLPEFIIPALRHVRPIMLFSVPLIMYKLVEAVDKTNNWEVFSSCKMITCGGAQIKKEFCELMAVKRGLPFYIGYGMSECSPTICVAEADNYEMCSCGKPIDCLQFKIDSDSPLNTAGEILVKGDTLFMGYYKDDSMTRNMFTEDGWFKTSDMAIMSKWGNVFICGRKNNQVSSDSGKNVFFEDIESHLRTSALIKDAVVCMHDGNLKAYVVLRDYVQLSSLQQVISDMNSRFLNGVYITEIQYLDKIEKTEKGTIKRSLYQ